MAEIIAGQVATQPEACASLLERVVTTGGVALARAGLHAMVESLPRVGAPREGAPSWSQPPRPTAPFVGTLLNTALRVSDAQALAGAIDHILATPALYPVDGVLLPAVEEVVKAHASSPEALGAPPLRAVYTRCVEHLETRRGPVEAPRDQRRPFERRCRCAHCGRLAEFMGDPRRAQWTYAIAEAGRNHLANALRGCDATTETLREGRPYKLVVTKNDASYQRLAAQRRADDDALALLTPRLRR